MIAISQIQVMEMTPLLSEGLQLALYGMGTVFFFLTFLVFATLLMSWIVAPEEAELISREPVKAAEAKKMAAVVAAIHQHRNR